MRAPLVLFLVAACSKDPAPKADASITVGDSRLIDAPKPTDATPPTLDATPIPPDATPMNIAAACANACTAIYACLMEPPDPDCNAGCAEDLGDCTAQQVMTIDACSTQPCGDIENKMSPLLNCIIAVPCVGNGGMAFTDLRK